MSAMNLVNLGRSILNLQNVTRILRVDQEQEVIVQFTSGPAHTYRGEEAMLLWQQCAARADQSPAALALSSDEWMALISAGERMLDQPYGVGAYRHALQRAVDRLGRVKGGL